MHEEEKQITPQGLWEGESEALGTSARTEPLPDPSLCRLDGRGWREGWQGAGANGGRFLLVMPLDS